MKHTIPQFSEKLMIWQQHTHTHKKKQRWPLNDPLFPHLLGHLLTPLQSCGSWDAGLWVLEGLHKVGDTSDMCIGGWLTLVVVSYGERMKTTTTSTTTTTSS